MENGTDPEQRGTCSDLAIDMDGVAAALRLAAHDLTILQDATDAARCQARDHAPGIGPHHPMIPLPEYGPKPRRLARMPHVVAL